MGRAFFYRFAPSPFLFLSPAMSSASRPPYPSASVTTGPQGRFVVLHSLGSGTYGQVFFAWDEVKREYVALKRLPHVLRANRDGKTMTTGTHHERLLMATREVKVMQMLDDHHLIVQLKGVFGVSTDTNNWQSVDPQAPRMDLVLVLELCDYDMSTLIRKSPKITDDGIRHMMKELLQALVSIHSLGVVHRDVKPNNVFLKKTPDSIHGRGSHHIRLGDFGMARFYRSPREVSLFQSFWPATLPQPLTHGGRSSSSVFGSSASNTTCWKTGKFDPPGQMSHYVNTLIYRAFEVLLGSDRYGPAVDQWSVGCLFAELLQCRTLKPGDRRPLFWCSKNVDSQHCLTQDMEQEQLRTIFEVIGTPTEADIKPLTNYAFARDRLALLKDYSFHPVWPSHVCPAKSPEADLLRGLLEFSPQKRLTAEQALRHPYFTGGGGGGICKSPQTPKLNEETQSSTMPQLPEEMSLSNEKMGLIQEYVLMETEVSHAPLELMTTEQLVFLNRSTHSILHQAISNFCYGGISRYTSMVDEEDDEKGKPMLMDSQSIASSTMGEHTTPPSLPASPPMGPTLYPAQSPVVVDAFELGAPVVALYG